MASNFTTALETDVLVLGAGLAGLKAAYTAAENGSRVLLAVKTHLCSGASFYPLMDSLGCQAPLENGTDPSLFLEEINQSSLGMNDEALCQYYIEEINSCMEEMPQMGIPCNKLQEEKLACFAKRSRTIYVWGNWKDIRKNSYAILEKHPTITLKEHHQAVCLLTQSGQVQGAILQDEQGGLHWVKARAVVLATGGYGNLYQHNLNTPDVSGDGQALALMAGASLINMEFMQFIPGFITPHYKTILREGSLLHCEGLFNKQGENILRAQFPSDETYQHCLELRATHGPFTCETASRYFDIALMEAIRQQPGGSGAVIRYSPTILKDKREVMQLYLAWLKDTLKFDLLSTPIVLAPFFHAANGGVWIDSQCSTSVKGLFAAGEVAGGIHGADRHGGNATGSSLVFGRLAGRQAAQYAAALPCPALGEAEAKGQLAKAYPTGKAALTPDEVHQTIQQLMWTHANILRTEAATLKAMAQVQQLERQYSAGAFMEGKQGAAAVKAQHHMLLAKAILTAIDGRKESRGSHYRIDYPHRDDEHFLRRQLLRLASDGTTIEASWAPPATSYRP